MTPLPAPHIFQPEKQNLMTEEARGKKVRQKEEEEEM